MKKFSTFMLILTMMFPGYCFANTQETPPSVLEIMDEISLIAEDGVIEKIEIENFMLTLDETDIVSPRQVVGENCFQAIVFTIAYLWLAIEADSLDQITSIVFLLINIVRIVSEC